MAARKGPRRPCPLTRDGQEGPGDTATPPPAPARPPLPRADLALERARRPSRPLPPDRGGRAARETTDLPTGAGASAGGEHPALDAAPAPAAEAVRDGADRAAALRRAGPAGCRSGFGGARRVGPRAAGAVAGPQPLPLSVGRAAVARGRTLQRDGRGRPPTPVLAAERLEEPVGRRPRPGLPVGRTGRPRACPRTDRPVPGVTSGPRARLRPTTPASGTPRCRARSGSPPIRDEAVIRRQRRAARVLAAGQPVAAGSAQEDVRTADRVVQAGRSGRGERSPSPAPAIHARGSGARGADCRRSAISLFR